PEDQVFARDPGARDQAVEAAELVDRPADGSLDVVAAGDVARELQRLAALRVGEVEVGDGDLRALRGKPGRATGADAPRAAGDQHNLPVESRHGSTLRHRVREAHR